LFDEGDYDAALVEFRALFGTHPEWGLGHDAVAKIFMAKRDYAAAVPEWQKAILQNPTSADPHRLLGQTFLLLHQQRDALRELQIAVELSPDSPVSHHYLGTALFEIQKFYAASKEFREALRLQPNANNHYSLAACLITMGDYDDALLELNAAARLDPAQGLYQQRREELIRLMKASKSGRVEIPSHFEVDNSIGTTKQDR
jgi:tetratricopeptide (TPR) repeat protein